MSLDVDRHFKQLDRMESLLLRIAEALEAPKQETSGEVPIRVNFYQVYPRDGRTSGSVATERVGSICRRNIPQTLSGSPPSTSSMKPLGVGNGKLIAMIEAMVNSTQMERTLRRTGGYGSTFTAQSMTQKCLFATSATTGLVAILVIFSLAQTKRTFKTLLTREDLIGIGEEGRIVVLPNLIRK